MYDQIKKDYFTFLTLTIILLTNCVPNRKIEFIKSEIRVTKIIIMCGIFAFIDRLRQDSLLDYLKPHFDSIKHRGPDKSTLKEYSGINPYADIYFGFHRLAMVGLDDISNQPLKYPGKDIYAICNGEIYNFKELIEQFKFDYKTHSDCEVIVHLYERFGISKTVQLLDGEFAFVLYD